MIAASIITVAAYCAALHITRRVRAYVPPGKVRDAIDTTLRVMGGGGGPAEPF
jgi:hypothetical protein